MPGLVVFHQSAELYGSDFTIFQLIRFISERRSDIEIKLIIPSYGPLVKLVEPYCEVIISDVVKVERSNFKLSYLVKLPFILLGRLFFLKKLTSNFDGKFVVYNNTMAVLGSFYYGLFYRNVFGHVHEIIEKPRFLALALCKVYALFNHNLIFNSHATQKWFVKNSKFRSCNAVVVHNGVNIKPILAVNRCEIHIALVGRINEWKGHQLLLSAFHELTSDYNNIFLDFYGDVYSGKDAVKKALVEYVEANNLYSKVKFHGFVERQDFWAEIDILVVPSTEPEPFGMVAIQGMANKIPVVVSNHGGLSEIVTDDTGVLFSPGNHSELVRRLKELIDSPGSRKSIGNAGYCRVLTNFSEEAYGNKILSLLEEYLDD